MTTPRILVIEDNPINLHLIAYLLKSHGCEVLSAVDGAAGLDLARAEHPDLILSDIQMPVLDGFAVAQAAKADAALQTTPLVAVTAFAMVGDRERVLAGGFDGYISKPIEPEAFISLVNRFLPADRQARPAY